MRATELRDDHQVISLGKKLLAYNTLDSLTRIKVMVLVGNQYRAFGMLNESCVVFERALVLANLTEHPTDLVLAVGAHAVAVHLEANDFGKACAMLKGLQEYSKRSNVLALGENQAFTVLAPG